jgi:hypothetical protein
MAAWLALRMRCSGMSRQHISWGEQQLGTQVRHTDRRFNCYTSDFGLIAAAASACTQIVNCYSLVTLSMDV